MSGDVVSPVFIGRREEMAVLVEALEQAVAEDPDSSCPAVRREWAKPGCRES